MIRMMLHKYQQSCPETYITKEGKKVACMGFLHFRKNHTELYCHLCGYTVKLSLIKIEWI